MTKIRYPLAHHSASKNERLVIAITRYSVETGDTRPLLDKLLPLAPSREAPLHWEGKLTFYFEGWDLDPRETQEIPEIRANFLEVTAEFPYWLHFVEKEGETLLHLFRLLCRCHSVRHDQEPGLVGWRFDDLREFDRQLGLLFNAMNHL